MTNAVAQICNVWSQDEHEFASRIGIVQAAVATLPEDVRLAHATTLLRLAMVEQLPEECAPRWLWSCAAQELLSSSGEPPMLFGCSGVLTHAQHAVQDARRHLDVDLYRIEELLHPLRHVRFVLMCCKSSPHQQEMLQRLLGILASLLLLAQTMHAQD